MDITAFRTMFPEFTEEAYPTPLVTAWSGVAEKLVSECRWGSSYTFGVQLFTAHQLVIAKSNEQASAVGGLLGQNAGPANSKTVGAASVSYDTATVSEANAGFWNQTTYGKQYIRLARMFGAGAVQL